ncbi:protein kinase, partial [Chloroflexota bacterium]
NPDGVKYCGKCGEVLQDELTCPSGHINPNQNEFCFECGQPLTEEVATPPTKESTTFTIEPTSFVDNRYQVKKKLGEGGGKKVYLAYDTKLDREVAFALLKTDQLGEEPQIRITREGQAMGRLGDHPNILTVYHSGEDRGKSYLVMPAMTSNVKDLIDGCPNRQLPMDRIVSIARNICHGLKHAHSEGIIHCDLKSSNIMLDADGQARIGDFGLVTTVDDSQLTESGKILGTVSYMSPEQVIGKDITIRSDLYSMGIILYEMATGRLPFTRDRIKKIKDGDYPIPDSPSLYRPDIPPALEALIMRLLENEKQQRPATADDVLDELKLVEASKTDRFFVGREDELKDLKVLYDGLTSSQGSLVMIEGEPGIGKSALCEQLAAYASSHEGVILNGHCEESSIPYLAFIEVIRSYLLHHNVKDIKKHLGSTLTDLARIVPELGEGLNFKARTSGNPQEKRYRLIQAVSHFLTGTDRTKSCLVIIEDLHYADKGTLDMLVHICRNLSNSPLLVVVTCRDTATAYNQVLSETLSEIRRIIDYRRISLDKLNSEEVGKLLSLFTGQGSTRDIAEEVYKKTEGNPLFVNEIIRYLMTMKSNNRERKPTKITRRMVRDMDLPRKLRGLINKRVSELNPGCIKVLTPGAVIGREFRLNLLRHLVEITEDEMNDALRVASRSSIVDVFINPGADITYRFSHDFLRRVIYDDIDIPERIHLHQQVAQVMETVYKDNLEEHAFE